jgi:hypothetical protein
MSTETRNRAIGALMFLLGIGDLLLVPDFSEGISLLLSFTGGACLGAGAALMMTGKPLWSSSPW